MQVVPISSPHRFKAVSCAVLGGDTVQAGKEIVKGQRLDELQAYGLGSLDHKTPRQGIAAIQLGRVGIVPGGKSAVRAAARVGGDTAGLDGDGRFGVHTLRLGDVEGHRLLCQLGQLDGLVHIGGRNIDRAGGRLIAKLADGVGVVGILGSDIDILAFFAVRRLLVNGGVSLFQCYRRIIGGKLQGNDRQFDKGNIDRLIFGAHGHLAGGGLIALFGDGVGVVRRGFYGEYAIAAGDGFAFLIFQSDRRVRLVRRYGQRVQRGNGEVFQPNAITAGIHRVVLRICDRNFVACFYFYRLIRPVNSPSFR